MGFLAVRCSRRVGSCELACKHFPHNVPVRSEFESVSFAPVMAAVRIRLVFVLGSARGGSRTDPVFAAPRVQ